MECKACHSLSLCISSFRVLIETLWNVKLSYIPLTRIPGLGINRNIVECKAGYRAIQHSCFLVLIETLWNVKSCPVSYSKRQPRINRNIVECKVDILCLIFFFRVRINRNIVECKGICIHSKFPKIHRINRNIVECKVQTMSVER